MFKKFVLIAVLALVTVLGSVAIGPPQAAEASADCSSFLQFSLTGLTVTGSISAFIGPVTINVDANEALTITVNAVSGSGTHWIIINGTTVGTAAWGESVTYVFPSTGAYSFNHTIQGNGVVDVFWGCGQVVAGCDLMVSLPSTAVVGSITDNAAVYYAPGEMTGDVLEVGKTFWMDGLDETGVYRKTLISCTWVWVEAAKTGPNYDEVWNGVPLPGHTVD